MFTKPTSFEMSSKPCSTKTQNQLFALIKEVRPLLNFSTQLIIYYYQIYIYKKTRAPHAFVFREPLIYSIEKIL